MKKVSMISLGLLLAAAQVNAAEASDGTINFTGQIESQTCTVSVNGGTSTGTVVLPTVSSSLLKTSGQTAGSTRFTIDLSDCSTQTGDVYAYFEQGSNVNANGRLNNTGTAENVELQLLDNASNALNAGSTAQTTSPVTATLAAGAATLTYAAEYFATAAATSGTVASSVTYSINYL
ncbi:fimbrial protein (plasmid) [Pantoea sp. S-LA4]|jgi:major type 1 subunit fimbrin (pilin)|uniref:fimbrial protein n=1 Tax=Pantoea TaxID=53335 RepID=UPI001F328B0F|nr:MULTISPECIES: fimbrial protein [Pantoea]UIL54923.1 type 1 fimbrial protein [Pantoea agglomerans]